MDGLKDNNSEVYKIFSEGNVVIRFVKIENGQDWHPIHLVIKQIIMRSLKSNGTKKRGTGFTETQRGVWLLLLLISSTFNRSLSYKWVMQEFHKI